MMSLFQNVKANSLDCVYKVSLHPSYAITFTFELMPLGKVWTPLSPSYGLNIITADL